jgi:hypothetical protein
VQCPTPFVQFLIRASLPFSLARRALRTSPRVFAEATRAAPPLAPDAPTPAVGRDPPARAAAAPPLPALPPPRSLLPPPPLPQPQPQPQPHLLRQEHALAGFYQPARGPPHWAAPRRALGAAPLGWPAPAPPALVGGAVQMQIVPLLPSGALAGALAPLALAPLPGPLLRAEARAAAPQARRPPSPLPYEAVFPAPLVPLALAPEDLLGFLPPPRLGGAGGSAAESSGGDDDYDDCAEDGLARAFADACAAGARAPAALPRAAGARAPASDKSSDSGSAGGGGGRARGRGGCGAEVLTEAYLRSGGYFDLPIKAAAAKLDRGVTTLKKACRSFGLRRWPFRHRASMRAAREKAARWAPDAAAALAEFGAAAEADAPSADARRMRQAVFKAEYRAAHAGPGRGRAGAEEALRKTLLGLAP